MHRIRRKVIVLNLGVVALMPGGVALAAGTASAAQAALALFEKARLEMDAADYEQACSDFVESERLDPGGGTMLNLGYCYEKLRKPAIAWTAYRDAAVIAREQRRLDFEQQALAQTTRLESSLPRVVFLVAKDADVKGLDVRLDDVPLPESAWGQPTPVDPGFHALRAQANGRRPWSVTFQVNGEEVQAEHVQTITVPRLEPAVAPPIEASTIGGERSSNGLRPNSSPGSALRTASVVTGVAGVATLAFAGGMGLWAKSTFDSAECPAKGHCTAKGMSAISRAHLEAGVADAAGIAGGAALVGAALMWIKAPTGRTELRVAPSVGQSAWGLSLFGAW